MINIAIAENQALVRAGLKSLLSEPPDIAVVAETEDGLSAIDLAKKIKPDVLLLELDLPRAHGIEVIRRIRSEAKSTHTIVLSTHAEPSLLSEAMRAGASAYLLKSDTPEELRQAITAVSTGEHFISPQLKKVAFSVILGKNAATNDPYLELTEREREVLQHAAQGFSNAHIGKALFISSRTVESHRSNFMRKLNLTSQTDLVRYAIRRKIISP